MLRAHVAKRLGDFQLDVALDVAAGSTLVLVGESGAGKTTLLRVLAGLDAADGGRIDVGGECWLDGESALARPAWQRDVGYLFQNYALFPHLSVAENVAFGLRAAGRSRGDVRTRTDAMLARFNLVPLAGRRPGALSGGQQQRVALARALALEPALLLLDEPLSALDLQTRRSVRGELRRLLAELPCVTIFVTHSPMEALVFGDRIAVLESGRVSQLGTRDELLRHPRSAYVAEFMGVNLFRGRLLAEGASASAAMRVRTAEGTLTIGTADDAGDELFVAVSPREITLSVAPPVGSAQNVLRGTVRELVAEPPFGERVRVALDSSPPVVAEVTAEAVAALGLREGMAVYASFKATGATPYR